MSINAPLLHPFLSASIYSVWGYQHHLLFPLSQPPGRLVSGQIRPPTLGAPDLADGDGGSGRWREAGVAPMETATGTAAAGDGRRREWHRWRQRRGRRQGGLLLRCLCTLSSSSHEVIIPERWLIQCGEMVLL